MCVAVCPEGAMKLANSFCDNAPGLFQVWYIRALFIKQQDLILSIEVTAYTSAGQPVRHVAESGEVYMDFDTAMEIIVVTLSAYESSGSNTQIMMRVVSLEEELLDVHQGVPIEECHVHTPFGDGRSTVAVAFEPAGPSSTPPAWSNSGESAGTHAETVDVEVVACGFLCGLRSLSRLQWAVS